MSSTREFGLQQPWRGCGASVGKGRIVKCGIRLRSVVHAKVWHNASEYFVNEPDCIGAYEVCEDGECGNGRLVALVYAGWCHGGRFMDGQDGCIITAVVAFVMVLSGGTGGVIGIQCWLEFE
jgi:hypothetical protein